MTFKEALPRPPVVTVMGHVDHGKTTLLDTIRKTRTASLEDGGITQHIGFYSVGFQGKTITFIDTPGHEAFYAMRSRGGKVADIVVLVIDAVDGVMPQTLEALAHAREAQAAIIVAINKIDLPGSNVNLVKKQLAGNGLLVEGFGGDTVCVEISAKTGQNVEVLLEMIILTASMIGFKDGGEAELDAYIIESRLDRRRGPVASVIVKGGRLSLGDEITAGEIEGKIKQILDDRGERMSQIPPGFGGEILGFSRVPKVGDKVVLGHSAGEKSGGEVPPQSPEKGNALKIIIKADVSGSREAVENSLKSLANFNSQANILLSGVGDITDSDVNLAKAARALIFGFRVKLPPSAARLAESLGVEIRLYEIIYKLVEEVELGLSGMLAWKKEEGNGQALILRIFVLNSGDKVFGCRVIQGKLVVGDRIVLKRSGLEVAVSRIKSLRIGKIKVEKAAAEKECGVMLNSEPEVVSGDVIEVQSASLR